MLYIHLISHKKYYCDPVFNFRLCTHFEIESGGFFKYKDFETHPKGDETYTPQAISKSLCINFDDEVPDHCASDLSNPCNKLPLRLDRRITRTGKVSVLVGDGWRDPWPKHGLPEHASGIQNISVELLQVKPLTRNMLEVVKASLNPEIKKVISVHKYSVNKREIVVDHNITFILPKSPVLYCAMLEVHDVAGNVRYSRRFVLFDNISTIEITHKYQLKITSASSTTGLKWQTNHNSVCVNWKHRYYNSHYINNNLLAPIKSDINYGITGIYDQEIGKLSVNGTKSINGLTGFIYSYSLNNGPYTSEKYMSDFEKESICFNFFLSDGDTYTFRITAEDVMENRLAENVTVHIDRTVPDISNMWLVRNKNKKLFVHHSVDLSHMVLQFEAMDPHSGIFSMEWFLGTQVNTSDVGKGALPAVNVSTSVRFNCSNLCDHIFVLFNLLI